MRTVMDLTTLKFKKSYIKIQVRSQDTGLGKMFVKLIKVNLNRQQPESEKTSYKLIQKIQIM